MSDVIVLTQEEQVLGNFFFYIFSYINGDKIRSISLTI